MICQLLTVNGHDDYCPLHQERHPGHLRKFALDPGPKGEAFRKVRDQQKNLKIVRNLMAQDLPLIAIAMPCSSCTQPPDPVMAQHSIISPSKPISFLSKVKHYVGAQLQHISGGMQKVPEDVRAHRRSFCETCEHRDPEKDECRLCGCPLHRTILGDKLGMASEYCEAGKWGTYPKEKGKIPMSHSLGKIRPYILAIPKRLNELQSTLERWNQSDWPGDPIVCMQHPDLPVNTQLDRWRATATNSYNLIKQMWKDDLDYGLFTEDDIEPNKHIYWNLVNWAPLARGEINIASLYMPNTVEIPFYPTREDRPDQECEVAIVNKEENWRIPKPMNGKFPRHNLWGSQCYVMSKAFIKLCIEQWWDVPGGQDSRVNRLAGRMGWPIYYHAPDLVQHHHPDSGSNFNSPHHVSADFSATWKSPQLTLTKDK